LDSADLRFKVWNTVINLGTQYKATGLENVDID